MKRSFVVLLTGLELLAPAAVRAADGPYDLRPIVKLGDPVGETRTAGAFYSGTVNDRGDVTFVTQDANPPGGGLLVQYSDGKLIPIVAGGAAAPLPSGTWPLTTFSRQPPSMNQSGNVVFASSFANDRPLGTFVWDQQSETTTAIALQGMPALEGRTFAKPADIAPVNNNRDEVAFPARVSEAAGLPESGIFFRDQNGALRTVLLAEQAMPDGTVVDLAASPSLSDAGVIAFRAHRVGDRLSGASAGSIAGSRIQPMSGYLRENGTICPVALAGQAAPGGGIISDVQGIWVNNQNRSVLVQAFGEQRTAGPSYLYLWAGGKLTPVAAPGQTLPGGGTLVDLSPWPGGVSPANDRGQHVFVAEICEGCQIRVAAYRMDADGTLSLVLKTGDTTRWGKIEQVAGYVASLNNPGQVLLDLQIAGQPEMLALVTPAASTQLAGR